MMRDTSPAQADKYFALLAKMSPAQRLMGAAGLSRAIRTLALAGIRNRHPAASEHEQKVRLCALLYGRPAALRLFGEVPPDAP